MQKTINGITYTSFETGKMANELCIDISRKFIVVDTNNGNNYHQNGDVIDFIEHSRLSTPLSTPSAYFTKNGEKKCLMYWSELAYYDEPKFKVGDRVRLLEDTGGRLKKGDILTISDTNNRIFTDKNGIDWYYCDKWLELVEEKQEPLKNTIIVDIKDEEQHKRVQEKLFGMGLCWLGGEKYILNNYNGGALGDGRAMKNIIVGETYFYHRADGDLPYVNYKKITASEFLMENITSFFNDLTVSAEDKELRKAGLKNGDLCWSGGAFRIVLDLEAKSLGYKNYNELEIKVGYRGQSVFELERLFTKFYPKLLETAKKFNKREDKKK